MIRIVFAIAFSIASFAMLGGGLAVGVDTPAGEILVNLGTEVFGILVTIALVDWFLEKRRRQDRARELAWGVLHDIENAVWVWQGGPRHLGTDDLLGLVTGIGEEDEMQPYTEGLMQNIGLRSRGVLQTEPTAIKSLPGLKDTFEDLVSLANVKDHRPSALVSVVSEVLGASVTNLARVLGQPTERMPSALIWYRDPTPEGQERRYLEMWPSPGGGWRGSAGFGEGPGRRGNPK
jgi:hypothetical protein